MKRRRKEYRKKTERTQMGRPIVKRGCAAPAPAPLRAANRDCLPSSLCSRWGFVPLWHEAGPSSTWTTMGRNMRGSGSTALLGLIIGRFSSSESSAPWSSSPSICLPETLPLSTTARNSSTNSLLRAATFCLFSPFIGGNKAPNYSQSFM